MENGTLWYNPRNKKGAAKFIRHIPCQPVKSGVRLLCGNTKYRPNFRKLLRHTGNMPKIDLVEEGSSMKIGGRKLPDHFVQYLKSQPETGMGYQIATIRTAAGKTYERVLILNSSEIATIDGKTEVSLDPNEIAEIVVTHDKSG